MSFIDLAACMADWPYHADRISVRKIRTESGDVKIQQRVELGIVQMDSEGRPDGAKPFECDTLLAYHQERLADYENRNTTTVGFNLNAQECRQLREEAAIFYRRYVASFVLEEYDRVVKDTAHNLAILDLIREYAAEEEDRERLESFRPYIIMMHARGHAHQALREGETNSALAHVNRAFLAIRNHFDEMGTPEAWEPCEEVKMLEQMRGRIVGEIELNPVDQMNKALQKAVEDEQFEEAARLRDELDKMERGD